MVDRTWQNIHPENVGSWTAKVKESYLGHTTVHLSGMLCFYTLIDFSNSMIHSPRSQAASTVSRDSSELHIIGGYNIIDGGSFSSLQRVGLEGAHQEQLIIDVGRLASAVTLLT